MSILYGFSEIEQLFERLWFLKMHAHVIFTKVVINELASVIHEVASARDDLAKPLKQLALPLASYHAVELT
jgi:hypothetical protein